MRLAAILLGIATPQNGGQKSARAGLGTNALVANFVSGQIGGQSTMRAVFMASRSGKFSSRFYLLPSQKSR